jgi:hypothetical protein
MIYSQSDKEIPMTVPSYTVYSQDDHTQVYRMGLSLIDAMDFMLMQDGHKYEIRKTVDNGEVCRHLWRTDDQITAEWRAEALVKTVIFSALQDEMAAVESIASQVIDTEWTGLPRAMLDSDYQHMLAKLQEDAEDESHRTEIGERCREIGWSMRQLAARWDCHERLARGWAEFTVDAAGNRKSGVTPPAELLPWLRDIAKAIAAHPVPRDWRARIRKPGNA